MKLAIVLFLICLALAPAAQAQSNQDMAIPEPGAKSFSLTDVPSSSKQTDLDSVVFDNDRIKNASRDFSVKNAAEAGRVKLDLMDRRRDYSVGDDYQPAYDRKLQQKEINLKESRQKMIDRFVDERLGGFGKVEFRGPGYEGRLDYGYARRCGVKRAGVCLTVKF